MELYEIIAHVISRGGADMYIVPGSPLVMKCKGRYENIGDDKLTAADTEILLREIYGMSDNRSLEDLLYSGDDDFSFSIQNIGRFRCSAYRQRGSLAAVLRMVSSRLPDPGQMHIPRHVMELADTVQGMVVVTGPAGSGRSTTLACMVDRINNTRQGHIVTIEDPIEYLHNHAGCIVSQREVRTDTGTFSGAMNSALRQGADVIMLGELPDASTIQLALNAAETGRLVLAGGYTRGLAKTVRSMCDVIAEPNQQTVRAWLSLSLTAVVTQLLLPTVDGDVVPVFDVARATPEIRAAIREGEPLSRFEKGLDGDIFALYKAGRISRETALMYAADPYAMVDRVG